MAKVTKLSAHKWRVRYDEYDSQGKRHQRMKDFERAADANAFRLQVENGNVTTLENIRTFTEYAREWFEVSRPYLEHNTQLSYATALRRLTGYFGNRRMDAITPSDIEKCYAHLLNQISASSLVVPRGVLGVIFKRAVRDGIIQTNPFIRARCPKHIKQERKLPELEAVIARISETRGTNKCPPIALALYCGMRLSEVLGLKWSDIDFETSRVNILRERITYDKRATLNEHCHLIPDLPNYFEKNGTKNGHTRSLTMPQALVQILREEQQRQRVNRLKYGVDYFVSDYICVNENGKPMSHCTPERIISDVCRFHDLRHMNVSYMFEAGIPLPEISRRAGHTSTSTTLHIYTHAINSQDKTAADALDAAFNITQISHHEAKM